MGPLHLEDLEPHRFEDLIRQLIYDFRPWRSLEATGRAGSDDGFDARAWEIVASAIEPAAEDDAEAYPGDDRQWLVQCKRERAIAPKRLAGYIDDIPVHERAALYGIVFAAACDFSKKSRDTFREKTRALGVAEAYLWGKGEIEDMLFQPKNDHLLFAYFGISLQTRRRSMRSDVRARLAAKRKVKRLVTNRRHILIRDATDERYPYLDDDETKDREDRGRWFVYEFEGCNSDGVHLKRRRQFAYIDVDGEHWDRAECMNLARPSRHEDPWAPPDKRDDEHQAAFQLWDSMPEECKAWYEEFFVLPYETIIDVDDTGDEIFDGPHILVDAISPLIGPFRNYTRLHLEPVNHWAGHRARADEDKRIEKFARQSGTDSSVGSDGGGSG